MELILTAPISLLIAIVLSFGIGSAAAAKPRQHPQQPVGYAQITCDMRGCSDRPVRAQKTFRETRAAASRRQTDANGNVTVVGRRPQGCPHAYCGCEASRYLFGKIRPELNLASNWVRRFPRSAPAEGMAAVRSHHVMILMKHVGGHEWLVHDGNSGSHLTREHVRSISGYIVVDPHGSRVASK
jgi:hypothetical protein